MLDEVSHVLQHFQPKPDFALTDFQRQQQQQIIIGRRRRNQRSGNDTADHYRHDNVAAGFSSVQYDGESHQLRLIYLHNQSYLLKFTILLVRSSQLESNNHDDDDNKDEETESVRRQISVTFGTDDNIPSDCIQSLKDCCTALSSSSSTTTTTTKDTNRSSTCSLFSILSSLLLTLQTLPRTMSTPNRTIKLLPPVTPVTSQATARLQMVMDLAVLLLRCAAASRRSATLCAPLPPQFCTNTNGGRFARIDYILPYTDLRERCSNTTSSSGQQRRVGVPPSLQQQSVISRSEHNFRTFLLSLPWITNTTTTVQITKQSGPTTTHICLNLDKGDPSPHFQTRAQKHGTLTTFHGSKPDNLWSILNYGLLEVSGTNLVENGAMLGKGIYSTTSYDVASFFAKQNASVSDCSKGIWRHAALRRLLGISVDEGFMNDTTVSCFAVFEAIILAPHTNNNDDDDDDDDDCNSASTRRDGKYYVVPNGDDIRLTKLHLTFQIGRKTEPLKLSLVPSWVFGILFAIGIAYLLQTYA